MKLLKGIMRERDGGALKPGTLRRGARAAVRQVGANHRGGSPESPSPVARASANSTVNSPRAAPIDGDALRDAVLGSMTWDEAADRVGCTKRMLLAIAAGTRNPSPELRRAIRRELEV